MFCWILALCISADLEKLKSAIRAELLPLIKDEGFWYHWRDGQGISFGDAIGYNDVDLKTPAEVDNQIPCGSVTKSLTAVAIMNLVDNDELDLDAKVAPLVDPWLMKYNGTTLIQQFGPTMNNVTIRQLLHMNAGIRDYDDKLVFKRSISNPMDIGPFEYIRGPLVDTTFLAEPGSTVVYSSVGYGILGMVLAAHVDRPWEEVNQLHFLREEDQAALNGVTVTSAGVCSKYPNVVTGYSLKNGTQIDPSKNPPVPVRPTSRSDFISVKNLSCLNGFGFGNSMMTMSNMTYFMDSLIRSSGVVSKRSVIEMTDFETMSFGVPGETPMYEYGLGLFATPLPFDLLQKSTSIPYQYSRAYGHLGLDYGTSGSVFYDPGYDATVAFGSNKDFLGSEPDLLRYILRTCKLYKLISEDLYPDSPQIKCTFSDDIPTELLRNFML